MLALWCSLRDHSRPPQATRYGSVSKWIAIVFQEWERMWRPRPPVIPVITGWVKDCESVVGVGRQLVLSWRIVGPTRQWHWRQLYCSAEDVALGVAVLVGANVLPLKFGIRFVTLSNNSNGSDNTLPSSSSVLGARCECDCH